MYRLNVTFGIILAMFLVMMGCNLEKSKESVAWGDVSNGLRIGLSMDKSKYKQGEPIFLKFHVKNVGKHSLWFLRAMDNRDKPHLDVEIQDMNSRTIYTSRDFQSYIDFLELAPGVECRGTLIPTSIEMLPEINEKFKGKGYLRGMSDDNNIALSKLHVGTYKAMVFYHFALPKLAGLYPEEWNKAWTGRAISKVVSFEVVFTVY